MSARNWPCRPWGRRNSALLLLVAMAACQPNAARAQGEEKREVPARRAGQLLFVGTEIPADKVPDDPAERKKLGIVEQRLGFLAVEVQPGTVPPEQCFTLPGQPNHLFRRWHEGLPPPRGTDRLVVYTQPRYFRTLQVGDRVQEGDLLALVDPTLALADLSAKAAKVEALEVERVAAAKTRDEAKARNDALVEAFRKGAAGVRKQDIRGALLNWQRFTQEEASKRSAVAAATQEMFAAHGVVRQHEIRATRSGVVQEICKKPGDAVKNGDPILRIGNP
jgi:Biotin-requiring enzyme